MANNVKIVCKNVFKNKDKAAFAKAFNGKWAAFIGQSERDKELPVPAK